MYPLSVNSRYFSILRASATVAVVPGLHKEPWFRRLGQRSNLWIELQGSNGMRSNFMVFIVWLGCFAPFAKWQHWGMAIWHVAPLRFAPVFRALGVCEHIWLRCKNFDPSCFDPIQKIWYVDLRTNSVFRSRSFDLFPPTRLYRQPAVPENFLCLLYSASLQENYQIKRKLKDQWYLIEEKSVSLHVFKSRLKIHLEKDSNAVPIQVASTWREFCFK